jgi:hypothetical protein
VMGKRVKNWTANKKWRAKRVSINTSPRRADRNILLLSRNSCRIKTSHIA